MRRTAQSFFSTKGLLVTAMLAGAGVATAPVAAQSTSPKDLLQCDKIKEPEDRLACFNTIVEKLKEDPDAFKRVTSGGHAGRDGKRASSGRSASDFGRSARPTDTATKITAKTRRLWRNARGKWFLFLDNGQIWRQTDSVRMGHLKEGALVTIKKKAFGSYRLVVRGKGGSMKVKRKL